MSFVRAKKIKISGFMDNWGNTVISCKDCPIKRRFCILINMSKDVEEYCKYYKEDSKHALEILCTYAPSSVRFISQQ